MFNKSDRNHLEHMKKSIKFFEESVLNLDSLLNIDRLLEDDLESLSSSVDQEWKETFRTDWWELELISSVMIDRGIEDLSKESKDRVMKAIRNIKVLIEQLLKENPIEDCFDDGILILTEIDKQHIQLIKENLLTFEKTNLDLDSLMKTSQSIKQLLDSLKSVKFKWRKAFRSEWWVLAFVYEITIDQKRSFLTHENKEKVLVASANMKKMIDDLLST